MPKRFLYFSFLFHIFLLVIISLNIRNIFTSKIKDNGHVVFDFVKISNKSSAPVLSSTNNHASEQKSFNESTSTTFKNNQMSNQSNTKINTNDKKSNIHQQKKENVNHSEKGKSKKEIDKLPIKQKNHKPIQEKQKNQDKKQLINKNKKNQSVGNDNEIKNKKMKNMAKEKNNTNQKNNAKAFVNLQEGKTQTKARNGKSSKINSLIDSALSDGEYENDGINAEEIGETLTATQIDLIRQTIRKCWHFPAGLKDADTLVVDIQMELDPDGYVKKAKILDQKRMQSDSAFRTAAENAYRAVLDPECNPLPLPKDKYNEWKELELSFNPKDLLN